MFEKQTVLRSLRSSQLTLIYQPSITPYKSIQVIFNISRYVHVYTCSYLAVNLVAEENER